jgi:protein-tyrosine-phosphatase
MAKKAGKLAGLPARDAGNRPRSVLFACSFNAIRSPMAEALARQSFGGQAHFQSVGLRAGDLDGFTVAVMAERGVDMTHFRSRTFDDLEDTAFDLIISLSPEAHRRALELARAMAIEAVYWPTMEPIVESGVREDILAAYRDVRDGLDERIRALFSENAEALDGAS